MTNHLLLIFLTVLTFVAPSAIAAPARVHIAAYDSAADAKGRADVVCSGINDQNLIQAVLDGMDGIDDQLCELIFESGTYHIDGFAYFDDVDELSAIRLGHNKEIVFSGYDKVALRDKFGVRFVVSPSAYDGFEAGARFCVINISKRNGRNFNHVELSNFVVELPDITHNVIGINTFNAGGATLVNLRLVCNGRGYNRLPAEGLVGIRGQNVNPNGFGQYWKDILCSGFHEAFQMGGEHIVAIGLLAYQSYYGYTFGNYPTSGDGVWEHPITLINCSEELCASLPLFADCGSSSSPNTRGLQCVDMISHTMELRRAENYTQKEVLPARETKPGTWCGNITFAANRLAQSYENAVDVKFWEDGSGTRFKTRNSAHAVAGCTAERMSYVPTYVQTYYDTDMKKMLVFDGRKWVDSHGKAVDRKASRGHGSEVIMEGLSEAALTYNTEDGRFYAVSGNLSANEKFRVSDDLQLWTETSVNLFDDETAAMIFSEGRCLKSVFFLKVYHAWRMFATMTENGRDSVITLSARRLCDGFSYDGTLCEGTAASAYFEGRDSRYGYPWLCWCKDGNMYTQRLKEDFSALESIPYTVAGNGVDEGYILWDAGRWRVLIGRGGRIYTGLSSACNLPFTEDSNPIMDSAHISAPTFDKSNRYFVLASNGKATTLERLCF